MADNLGITLVFALEFLLKKPNKKAAHKGKKYW